MFKDVQHWLRHHWLWGVLTMAGLLGIDAVINLMAERLWFVEVNYLAVFWLRLRSQLLLGLIPLGITLIFTWANLALADRTTPLLPPTERASKTQGLTLRGVLLLAGMLSFLVGLQLVYQGQIAANFWRETTTLYESSTPLPLWPKLQLFRVVGQILLTQPWLVGALGMSTVAFVVYPLSLIHI